MREEEGDLASCLCPSLGFPLVQPLPGERLPSLSLGSCRPAAQGAGESGTPFPAPLQVTSAGFRAGRG